VYQVAADTYSIASMRKELQEKVFKQMIKHIVACLEVDLLVVSLTIKFTSYQSVVN
jgi:hypothetical protein